MRARLEIGTEGCGADDQVGVFDWAAASSPSLSKLVEVLGNHTTLNDPGCASSGSTDVHAGHVVTAALAVGFWGRLLSHWHEVCMPALTFSGIVWFLPGTRRHVSI